MLAETERSELEWIQFERMEQNALTAAGYKWHVDEKNTKRFIHAISLCDEMKLEISEIPNLLQVTWKFFLYLCNFTHKRLIVRG